MFNFSLLVPLEGDAISQQNLVFSKDKTKIQTKPTTGWRMEKDRFMHLTMHLGLRRTMSSDVSANIN